MIYYCNQFYNPREKPQDEMEQLSILRSQRGTSRWNGKICVSFFTLSISFLNL